MNIIVGAQILGYYRIKEMHLASFDLVFYVTQLSFKVIHVHVDTPFPSITEQMTLRDSIDTVSKEIRQ